MAKRARYSAAQVRDILQQSDSSFLDTSESDSSSSESETEACDAVFHSGNRPRGGGVGSREGRMSPSPVWGLEQSPRKIFCHIPRGAQPFARGGFAPPPPGRMPE
jgi:hypothetical protein